MPAPGRLKAPLHQIHDLLDDPVLDVASGPRRPHGYNHIALGLVDPSLIESWSGQRVDGLPDLAGQLELFATQVVPALKDT